MARRISIKQMRDEAPAWIFKWGRGNYQFSKWAAMLFVAGVFAFLFSVLHVRVQPPLAWGAPKASVIHAGAEDSRILSLLAQEGGPFPSRFLPSQWDGAAVLEKELMEGSAWSPAPHVPVLRDLPKSRASTLELSSKGESILPQRLPSAAAVPSAIDSSLRPSIRPLSGITDAELPEKVPAMDGPVDAAMIAGSWRFLLRLDAAGHVIDCVSLAGGEENGPSSVEGWLRRVSFKPSTEKSMKWVSVAVDFVNQTTPHGTDAH